MSVSASARSARHLTPLLAMKEAINVVGLSLTSTRSIHRPKRQRLLPKPKVVLSAFLKGA